MTQLIQQFRVINLMLRFKCCGRRPSAAIAGFGPLQAAFLVGMLLSVLPTVATTGNNNARDLLAAGRADEAIQLLNSAVKRSPNDAQAYHLLSRVYYTLGKWDDAVTAAEAAVKAAPHNSDYRLWLGRAYGMKAQNSGWVSAMKFAGKARDEFEKAVELDASNVRAHSDLADYYLEAPGFLGGGHDKARREAERLAAHNPAAAHSVKGQIAEKDKNYQQAEAEYKTAIKQSKSPGEDWLQLAGFYRRTGRFAEMEKAVEQALAVENKRGNAPYEAARILVRSGRNLRGAAQLLRRYLASKALDVEAPAFVAHYLLGQVLEKLGDKKAAATEYRAALSMAKDYEQAQNALKRVER
jgi:tetratricopeptide (TPR) repeat protein